jgi:hypothetical protein
VRLHLVQDFPEVRTCPVDTLRALRVYDPSIDVLYLGPSPKGGRWMLGSVRHDSAHRATAAKVLANLQRVASHRRGIEWFRRYRMAKAAMQGFKGRAIYECVEPDARMVRDIKYTAWVNQHESDDEFEQSIDAEREQQQRANLADLTDPHRAYDAHRYAFTRSHAATRRDYVNRSSVVRDITPPKPAA